MLGIFCFGNCSSEVSKPTNWKGALLVNPRETLSQGCKEILGPNASTGSDVCDAAYVLARYRWMRQMSTGKGSGKDLLKVESRCFALVTAKHVYLITAGVFVHDKFRVNMKDKGRSERCSGGMR